jgi:hypothetical protein
LWLPGTGLLPFLLVQTATLVKDKTRAGGLSKTCISRKSSVQTLNLQLFILVNLAGLKYLCYIALSLLNSIFLIDINATRHK